MAQRICLTEECTRPAKARGLCGACYVRISRSGGEFPPKVHVRGVCTVDGCEKPHRAHGYCTQHDYRYLRYGDPLTIQRIKRPVFEVVPCCVEGCDQPTSLKSYDGMCEMHCARMRRTGTLEASRFQPRKDQTLAEVLWLRSEPHPSGCILWTGSLRTDGYGAVNGSAWSTTLPHRFSWMLVNGPVPDGMELDHVCHTLDPDCRDMPCHHRRCINPDHLEVVTHAENGRRGWERTLTP